MSDTQQEKFILVLFLIVVALGSINIFGTDYLERSHEPHTERRQA